ncbi:carbohydrate phosphatase [Aaosphaeria arxii CBS 175.79]|uniref:Carbohydrate phosphatase n=1 Tax=Aaosphaeria arxii CBS 175.79 TaxID=1450172 RepID=A0A6A5XU10_9PLEO|nr:carbohydrate phosphatase [Aaosphaeria arxii CBS 175.79]KAF2016808.1 carbohydrate phosphatase [Aaosphaeria arxii CBS 175.79]
MAVYNYERERQVAERAVLWASILTKQVQSSVRHTFKSDSSVVTIADFAVQAMIIAMLRDAFPGDRFLGEEDSGPLRANEGLCQAVWGLLKVASKDGILPNSQSNGPTSIEEMLELIDLGGQEEGGSDGRIWVMDPIDGTATFLKGQQYAVSLTLLDHGEEAVGVLGCPNISSDMTQISEENINDDDFGVMLTAVRNQGATMQTMSPTGLENLCLLKPIASNKPSKVRIVDCADCKVTRHDATRRLANNYNTRFPHTELWSAHMRYAALILGMANVLFWVPAEAESKVHIWDHAGSQLIFREVGGKITDLDGKPVDLGAGRDLNRNRGLVAARADIHQDLFLAMRNALAHCDRNDSD